MIQVVNPACLSRADQMARVLAILRDLGPVSWVREANGELREQTDEERAEAWLKHSEARDRLQEALVVEIQLALGDWRKP